MSEEFYPALDNVTGGEVGPGPSAWPEPPVLPLGTTGQDKTPGPLGAGAGSSGFNSERLDKLEKLWDAQVDFNNKIADDSMRLRQQETKLGDLISDVARLMDTVAQIKNDVAKPLPATLTIKRVDDLQQSFNTQASGLSRQVMETAERLVAVEKAGDDIAARVSTHGSMLNSHSRILDTELDALVDRIEALEDKAATALGTKAKKPGAKPKAKATTKKKPSSGRLGGGRG